MKYLKKYNESVNSEEYQKLVDIIELHLEDNPYFSITQFTSSEEMTGRPGPYIYMKEDFTNNDEMIKSTNAYIEYHDGDTTKTAWYDIIAKFEKIVLSRNTELLTRIGKMYDLEVNDIVVVKRNLQYDFGESVKVINGDFRKTYVIKASIKILQSSEIHKTI